MASGWNEIVGHARHARERIPHMVPKLESLDICTSFEVYSYALVYLRIYELDSTCINGIM
jgi:hypothetical protein